MKRIFICIAVLLTAFAAVVSVFLITGSDYAKIIEANWDISLSGSSLKEVFSADSGASFHGDGIRYHVFSYKNAPDLPWTEKTAATVFSQSFEDAAEEWLDRIGIPREMRPDYGNCVSFYQSQRDNSEIILFLDEDRKMLYVAESFL